MKAGTVSETREEHIHALAHGLLILLLLAAGAALKLQLAGDQGQVMELGVRGRCMSRQTGSRRSLTRASVTYRSGVDFFYIS